MTTNTTEKDLVEEVEELLAHPDVAQWASKSVRDVLRRLVDEVKALRAHVADLNHDFEAAMKEVDDADERRNRRERGYYQ